MNVQRFCCSTLIVALSVPAPDAARAQNPAIAAQPAVTAPSCERAIIDVAGHEAGLLRTRQLAGDSIVSALTIRRPSTERRLAGCSAERLSALPVRLRAVLNTGYPVDVNTGALWAGRGVSSALSAGAEARFGPITVGLVPVFVLHENRSFDLAAVPGSDRSPFSYAGHTIDWPQRHGDEAFHVLDPGQSFIRVDAWGVSAGVSTENLWLGPAQRMPLLMSSSAPGVPHVFLATGRPIDTRIGSIEAQFVWGRLAESAWFDGDPDNDHQLLALFSLAFEPAFARGLHLGVNRAYIVPFDAGDLMAMIVDPYVDVRTNLEGDNQLLSLYARWVLPRAGFEAYGEWAREDHWANATDLLLEPDHSQAWLLGFQKTGRLGRAQLRWFGEVAHLQSSLTLRAGRGVVTFYTHSRITQGYTHRGQLLGAWIGPGSDAQVIGVDRVDNGRISGLMIERVRFDNDAYYNRWGRVYGHHGHDVSLGFTLRHIEPIGRIAVGAAASLARRHNRNFVRFDGSHPGDFSVETNVQFDIDLRWQPPW